MSEWTIYGLDALGRREVQIDEYEKATCTPRFNDVGDWTIKGIPAAGASTAITSAASADVATWLGYWGKIETIGLAAGFEFVRDGVSVMSGPLTRRHRIRNKSTNSFDVSGKDDMVWLTRRLAKPVPAGPPYSSQAYDVRTGVASTVIRQYVDVNAGPGATVARAVPGLTLAADPLLGGTVTGRGRWQVLLELLNLLAGPEGLGFRIRGRVFEVYDPTDKSAEIVFSIDNGTMAEFEDVLDAPEVDWAAVGGGGVGTARYIFEWPDVLPYLTWGLAESFIDRRDTSDPSELLQSANNEFIQRSARRGVKCVPLEGPEMRFIDDYDLGDIVAVDVDGERIVDVVREVKIEIGPGVTITPTIGDPNAPKPTAIQQKIAEFGAKTKNLETI